MLVQGLSLTTSFPLPYPNRSILTRSVCLLHHCLVTIFRLLLLLLLLLLLHRLLLVSRLDGLCSILISYLQTSRLPFIATFCSLTPYQDGKDKATDEEIVKTQIESLLDIMMVQVQDRVCTTDNVLNREPLQLGVHIKEVPVWGIDCYTRRMVELSIEDHGKELFNLKTVHTFIEKRLLPTINAQSSDTAHNMSVALEAILAHPIGPTDAGIALKPIHTPCLLHLPPPLASTFILPPVFYMYTFLTLRFTDAAYSVCKGRVDSNTRTWTP